MNSPYNKIGNNNSQSSLLTSNEVKRGITTRNENSEINEIFPDEFL